MPSKSRPVARNIPPKKRQQTHKHKENSRTEQINNQITNENSKTSTMKKDKGPNAHIKMDMQQAGNKAKTFTLNNEDPTAINAVTGKRYPKKGRGKPTIYEAFFDCIDVDKACSSPKAAAAVQHFFETFELLHRMPKKVAKYIQDNQVKLHGSQDGGDTISSWGWLFRGQPEAERYAINWAKKPENRDLNFADQVAIINNAWSEHVAAEQKKGKRRTKNSTKATRKNATKKEPPTEPQKTPESGADKDANEGKSTIAEKAKGTVKQKRKVLTTEATDPPKNKKPKASTVPKQEGVLTRHKKKATILTTTAT